MLPKNQNGSNSWDNMCWGFCVTPQKLASCTALATRTTVHMAHFRYQGMRSSLRPSPTSASLLKVTAVTKASFYVLQDLRFNGRQLGRHFTPWAQRNPNWLGTAKPQQCWNLLKPSWRLSMVHATRVMVLMGLKRLFMGTIQVHLAYLWTLMVDGEHAIWGFVRLAHVSCWKMTPNMESQTPKGSWPACWHAHQTNHVVEGLG